jgi:hypothetical protein
MWDIDFSPIIMAFEPRWTSGGEIGNALED